MQPGAMPLAMAAQKRVPPILLGFIKWKRGLELGILLALRRAGCAAGVGMAGVRPGAFIDKF